MSAAVVTIPMTAAVVALTVVVVVGANRVGVIIQAPGQQGVHLGVGVAGGAGEKLDARLGQGVAGSAADAPADESLHPVGSQEAGQGPVAAAIGVYHLGGHDLPILHLVNLELLRVSEVLKYLTIFISNRKFHLISLLLHSVF